MIIHKTVRYVGTDSDVLKHGKEYCVLREDEDGYRLMGEKGWVGFASDDEVVDDAK